MTTTQPTVEANQPVAKARAAKGNRPSKRKPAGAPVMDTRLDKMLALLENQGAQLQQLNERVSVVEQGRPRFVPMRAPEKAPSKAVYHPPEELVKRGMKNLRKDGETASGRINYLQDPEFAKKLPPEYRPVFQSGDMVQINPEATVFGSDKRWSEILAKTKSEGVGEVLAVQLITKNYEPKYTVVVPGLTQRNGDGFRESELLPVGA